MENQIKDILKKIDESIKINPIKIKTEKITLATGVYCYGYSPDDYMDEKVDIAQEYGVGVDNVEIGTDTDEIVALVAIPATKTDKEIHAEKAKRFERKAWYQMRDFFKENGYSHHAYNSDRHHEFKDITLYDMYLEKNYDKIMDYYSLWFEKENANKVESYIQENEVDRDNSASVKLK